MPTKPIVWTTASLVLAVSTSVRASETPRTTSESIALRNLDFQIATFDRKLGSGADSILLGTRVELALVRSRFLGDFDELQRAHALALRRVLGPKIEAEAALSYASMLGGLHRFEEASAWLDVAEGLKADRWRLTLARAVIAIARGEAFEYLPWLEEQAESAPTLASHTTLAAAYASLGWFDEADRAFVRALSSYRDVSPFPVAWIQFQRGVMWAERAGDESKGRDFYASALTHLPSYVTANVHLAELERADDPAAAARRLEAILPTTWDPEPFGLLAEIYEQLGQPERAKPLATEAGRRYAILLDRFPDAFADHGAEFYLGVGANPARAFELALRNVKNRPTERAYAILLEAAAASQNPERCRFVREAAMLARTGVELHDADASPTNCPP